MKNKTKFMDTEMIQRSLMRMSHEILERNKGTQCEKIQDVIANFPQRIAFRLGPG